MVYGAILEKGNQYYTHLREILQAIEPAQNNCNWLITNCECYPRDLKTAELLSCEYCFLNGPALTALVEHEDFQWVWAVLSAFEKSLTLDKILAYPLPYADGNPEFWKNPLTIQHPLAQIEIVAFDSSLTLFLSNDSNLTNRFRIAFPDSEDLQQYNESNGIIEQ